MSKWHWESRHNNQLIVGGSNGRYYGEDVQLGRDNDAPIPNDDKDGPLANNVDSNYAKGDDDNMYARGKDDDKYARGNNDHKYADGNNDQEYARDDDHRGEGMLQSAGFAEGRELSK